MAIPYLDLVKRIKLHVQVLTKKLKTEEFPVYCPTAKRSTWTVEEDDFRNFIRDNIVLAKNNDLEETVEKFFSEKWFGMEELTESCSEDSLIYHRVDQGYFSYVNVAFKGASKRRLRFNQSTAGQIKLVLKERRRSRAGRIFYLEGICHRLGYSGPEQLAEAAPKRYLRPASDPHKIFYLTPKGYQIMQKKRKNVLDRQKKQEDILLDCIKNSKTTTDYKIKKSVTRAAACAAFDRMFDYQQQLREEGYVLPEGFEMFECKGRKYMPSKLFFKIVNHKRHCQRYWVEKWLKANATLNPSA